MNLTDEKMQNSKMEERSVMRENQFFGDISEKSANKECTFIGLIKNQKIVLEEELNEAKLKYADVALDDENWSGKYERKMACKILEGQISILSKLETEFENMLAATNKSMAMAM